MNNDCCMASQTCPICYDVFLMVVDDGHDWQQPWLNLHPCEHVCCRRCLYEHCQYSISIQQVPIRCPISVHGDDDQAASYGMAMMCRTLLNDQLVHEILFSDQSNQSSEDENTNIKKNDKFWNKYSRCLHKRRLLQCCPKCRSGLICADENDTNIAICPVCHLTLQDDVTDQATTAPNSKEDVEANDVNELLLQQYLSTLSIKPCSHCSVPLNKTSGCDHVICPACHEDMCFRCGSHQHLQSKGSLRCCTQCNKSYMDHRALPQNRMLRLFVYVLLLIDLLIMSMLAIVFLLVEFCCGCCCDSWFACRAFNWRLPVASRGENKRNETSPATEDVGEQGHISLWKQKVVGLCARMGEIFRAWTDLLELFGWDDTFLCNICCWRNERNDNAYTHS
jgi:hypothetical protein